VMMRGELRSVEKLCLMVRMRCDDERRVEKSWMCLVVKDEV